jgi:hypothetical protein
MNKIIPAVTIHMNEFIIILQIQRPRIKRYKMSHFAY